MTTDSTVFVWRGTDRNGQPSAGEEMASSAAMARAQLRRQGVTTKTVRKKAFFLTVLVVTPCLRSCARAMAAELAISSPAEGCPLRSVPRQTNTVLSVVIASLHSCGMVGDQSVVTRLTSARLISPSAHFFRADCLRSSKPASRATRSSSIEFAPSMMAAARGLVIRTTS